MPVELCRRVQNLLTQDKPERSIDSRLPKKFFPVLVESWVFTTIVVFFVVRVLGSNLVSHWLHRIGAR